MVPTLNNFDENRAHDVLRENLKEVPLGVAVDENIEATDTLTLLKDTRNPPKGLFIVGFVHVEGLNSTGDEGLDGSQNVVREKREVLDTRAAVLTQVLVDLRFLFFGFVDRNAKLSARRTKSVGLKPRFNATDIEVTDLAEVEDLFVEIRPVCHRTGGNVVREMVDRRETLRGMNFSPGNFFESEPFVKPFSGLLGREINQAVPDSKYGGERLRHAVQIVPLAGLASAARLDCLEGRRRIPKAPPHRADRRAMRLREPSAERTALAVEQEHDLVLHVKVDGARLMAHGFRESKIHEESIEGFGVRRSKLNELDSAHTQFIHRDTALSKQRTIDRNSPFSTRFEPPKHDGS